MFKLQVKIDFRAAVQYSFHYTGIHEIHNTCTSFVPNFIHIGHEIWKGQAKIHIRLR
jgi:hypothetical protein